MQQQQSPSYWDETLCIDGSIAKHPNSTICLGVQVLVIFLSSLQTTASLPLPILTTLHRSTKERVLWLAEGFKITSISGEACAPSPPLHDKHCTCRVYIITEGHSHSLHELFVLLPSRKLYWNICSCSNRLRGFSMHTNIQCLSGWTCCALPHFQPMSFLFWYYPYSHAASDCLCTIWCYWAIVCHVSCLALYLICTIWTLFSAHCPSLYVTISCTDVHGDALFYLTMYICWWQSRSLVITTAAIFEYILKA